MISSLVGSPSGFSMTTSQCSKSQPSSNMVSLGGRFDQLGLGSLSDDVVARVEKLRRVGGGRRKRSRRREEAAARARMGEGVWVEVEMDREKKDDARVRDLGRVLLHKIWVAIFWFS